MPKMAILGAAIVLISSGGYKLLADARIAASTRSAAPAQIERLVQQESPLIIKEIEQKLFSLHSYHIMGQKNLARFDEALKDSQLSELYHSYEYQNLLAIKGQVLSIENDLTQLAKALGPNQKKLLTERVKNFSKKSYLHALTTQTLTTSLKLKSKLNYKVSAKDIENEYQKLFQIREFQVFEKNIEHLAHIKMTEIKATKRAPASTEEFHSDSWKITFESSSPQMKPWNIDTLDWLAQTPDKIVKRTLQMIKKSKRDSGVIVFHQTQLQSQQASAQIKDHLNHVKVK